MYSICSFERYCILSSVYNYVVGLEDKKPLVSDIFRLFSSLEAGLTVKDMCFRSDPNALAIDERYTYNTHIYS